MRISVLQFQCGLREQGFWQGPLTGIWSVEPTSQNLLAYNRWSRWYSRMHPEVFGHPQWGVEIFNEGENAANPYIIVPDYMLLEGSFANEWQGKTCRVGGASTGTMLLAGAGALAFIGLVIWGSRA